jgi:Tetratricopeptide repeat
MALEQGNLDLARKWIPRGDKPDHCLLAARINLKAQDYSSALTILAPLTGQGAPTPVPPWRAPALLLAARASMAMERPEEAKEFLQRALREEPGRPEAVHNLQTLIKDSSPPPPDPKKPPPPPPIRPSMGARQDELEGIQQKLPPKPPPKGVKDI